MMGEQLQPQPQRDSLLRPKRDNKIERLRRILSSLSLSFLCLATSLPTWAVPPRSPDETVECELLIVGGGLAGAAAAYESLLAGRTVCLTDITDWIGGQLSSQGTSALDEGQQQRSLQYFPRGYQTLRKTLTRVYGKLNPGDCWVSESCFLPKDGHQILYRQLKEAEMWGRGKLKWFPATVIKELGISNNGKIINNAIAIQHNPALGKPALNSQPLSQVIDDAYHYQNSSNLTKKIIRFQPKGKKTGDWLVIEATETGEIIALADVPYRLGLDPRSHLNPSSPTDKGDAYCTQGFTYPFAMERTQQAQPQEKPPFYEQYEPYYGYDSNRKLAYFDLLFTYRRIWNPQPGKMIRVGRMKVSQPAPGDISMQNWLWGNDYRPGTSQDNLIYSRDQLQKTGQLTPGGWEGGLRQDTLRKGEELSKGFYYWLVAGSTDSRLGYGVKTPQPNHRLLKGLDSPMGTMHGLSKYPYIREGRRIIGRPSSEYQEGFSINEIDISTKDYWHNFYRSTLSRPVYQELSQAIARLETVVATNLIKPAYQITRRTQATMYPDSVGIADYMMDFHPCMVYSPPEKPGNREREEVRFGQGSSYPAQIPLRAMIPQKIDNLIVAGKSIATSHIAASAYRVHGFEWSVGAAAGSLGSFALERGVLPYQLVDNLPQRESLLYEFRQRLETNGNPTAFPQTALLNFNK